jgi:microcystin-dependent protein
MRVPLAATAVAALFILSLSNGTASAATTGPAGGSQPHSTIQPSAAINYMIRISGPEERLGEIVMTGTNFVQPGWAAAEGQLLAIAQNTSLFAVLGTTYGGDGQTTFRLPDLRGRTAMGQGSSFFGSLAPGQQVGTETVTLNTTHLPAHTHTLPWGGNTSPTGGGQPFNNVQPGLGISFFVPMFGNGVVFPNREDGTVQTDADILLGQLTMSAVPGAAGAVMAQGQILSIAQNTALFSILGTTYGGDGKSTFGLPDLSNAAPLGAGQGPGLSQYDLGQVSGETATTLLISEVPAHKHSLPPSPDETGITGGSQPTSNLQPTLALHAIIAVDPEFSFPGQEDTGDPFLGEMRWWMGNFAPAGWEFADGRLLAIVDHQVLFSLLGDTFGGDGQETFALPDLDSRLAVGDGQGPGLSPWLLGQERGVEDFTLTNAQMPVHTHEYTPQVVAAPEPLTFALFGVGLAGLGAVTRRRRRA